MKSRLPIGKKKDRLTRTIVLGAIAVFLAIIWLAKELDMDRDELLGYLVTSLLFVGVAIVFAMLAGGLVWLLKKLLG